MANTIINGLDDILAYIPINEAKEKPSVKTTGKKKHFIAEIKEETDSILKLADYIESNWNKLNAEQKERLKSFSYTYMGEGKKVKQTFIFKNIPAAITTAYRALKPLTSGKLSLSDFGDFFVALDRLNDVILSMIERENPAYKERLSGLIESAVKGEGKDMSYGEFNEWLNGVASKAGK